MKEQLKHGDQARIAEITGFTHDYVKKVMQGRRRNEKVLAVAQELLASREAMISKNKPGNQA